MSQKLLGCLMCFDFSRFFPSAKMAIFHNILRPLPFAPWQKMSRNVKKSSFRTLNFDHPKHTQASQNIHIRANFEPQTYSEWFFEVLPCLQSSAPTPNFTTFPMRKMTKKSKKKFVPKNLKNVSYAQFGAEKLHH